MLDARHWVHRWEAQQQFMVLRREERFEVMLELLPFLLGSAPRRMLDLACGTGSIAERALQRFSNLDVVALDLDPLLHHIGQRSLGDGQGRLTWVTADLRLTDWSDAIAAQLPFDAVLSSTALHWLTGTDVLRIYRDLAARIRPGGVFLNADRLPAGSPSGRLAQATEALRKRQVNDQQAEHAGESWADWWNAAESEPAFADLVAERNRLFEDNPTPRDVLTSDYHVEALAMAGFAERGVVWRYLDYAIVAGVR
jgi:SAM-dependent methyltransferase